MFIGIDTSKRSSSSMTMSMIASELMVRSLAITVSPDRLFAGLVRLQMGQISRITSARKNAARQGEGVSDAVVFDGQFMWGAQKRLSGLRGKTTHECQKWAISSVK